MPASVKSPDPDSSISKVDIWFTLCSPVKKKMQIGECAIALELCKKKKGKKNAVDSLSNSASSLRLQLAYCYASNRQQKLWHHMASICFR